MAAVVTPSWDTGYANIEATVANRALFRIGVDPIRDDAEETPSSRQTRAIFGQTRDELLRDYEFNFAQRILTLSLASARSIASVVTTINTRLLKRTWTSLTSNSTTTITGFSGLTVNELAGVYVTGSGIPTGAYIVSNTATEATLSAAATTSVSGTLTLTGEIAGSGPLGTPIVGWTVSGTGIPEGAYVTSSDGDGTLISANATATGTITLAAELNSGPWTYAYLLPTDLVPLKVLEIAGNKENRYEVVGAGTERRILCDMQTSTDLLEVKLIEQVVDPDRWDSIFLDAFVLRLASKLAIPLAKRPDLAQFLQSEFAAIYTLAKKSTSEETNIDTGETPWTDRTQVQ